MRFSYNWLQSYFKEKLPKPEKLAEALTMRAFEVETVEKFKRDYLLDVKILPNRMPDASGHLGLARECSAILGLKIIEPKVAVSKNARFAKSRQAKLKTSDYLRLLVKEPELCPRYVGLLVKGVKVGPSPKWLQERLLSIGQKPINNVVDIGNFVMLETGQPLHSFDLEKLGGKTITVRRAKNDEKITTLDNRECVLKPDMLVIADDKDALAIAGIKGGKKAEISEVTKDIIIEAAVFAGTNIRETSRSIGIRTDASLRFEAGLSLGMPDKAILRAATLMEEIAGGTMAKSVCDFSAGKIFLPRVLFSLEDITRVVGFEIKKADVEKILKSLGFFIEKSKNIYIAVPPPERTDISLKEDIAEELARIIGYENVKGEMPREYIHAPARNDIHFFMNLGRNILLGMGFSEVCNYSLVEKGDENLRLKNFISPERSCLRDDLSHGVFQNIKFNLRNFDDVKIFEIGKVFYLTGDTVKEKTHIALGLGYQKNKKDKEIFFEVKGACETLLNRLGVADVWFDSGEHLSCKIFSGQVFLGEIKENIFEMDFEKIAELAEEDSQYKPISKYPAIIRDLSLFVPVDTRMTEVLDIVENTGGQLLVDADLFDIYESQEENIKSLAFRLIFQSDKKTLTDEEVNGVMAKIIRALESNSLWRVRK